MGLLFDIFRILRKSFKTPDFITYLQDILFWIISGLILLYSIFKFNNGEIRLYIFIGIIIGISLYILIFSKAFVSISVHCIAILKKVIRILIIIPTAFIIKLLSNIIYKPIILLCKKIKARFKRVLSFLGIKLKKIIFRKRICKNKKDFA